MKAAFLSMVVALAFCFPVMAEDVDRTDPVATAVTFLKGYQARDLNRLVPLVMERHHEMFALIAEEGEGHKKYKRVFSGWRADVIDGWDGELLGKLRFHAGMIAVPFSTMPADDEVAVLLLAYEDGIWAVGSVAKLSTERFERLPAGRQ